MSDSNLPFVRKAHVDKPGIIGAQWWQDSVATQISRRKAVQGLAIFGGILAATAAVGGVIVAATSSSSSGSSSTPEVKYEPRSALSMQKTYGWDFGAEGEALVFDGVESSAFDRSALAHLADDLEPKGKLVGHAVRTLFESPSARPTQQSTLDASYVFKPLDEVLLPIHTPEMTAAFARGAAFVDLLMAAKAKRPLESVAVHVDLPGPEAVAFAAGAAAAFQPVFLFDNWPHPRGVVPSHRTLAATAYYQPLFAREAGTRPATAPALFVVDRARLTTYTDDATQFDNRYVAKTPPASLFTTSGVKDVLYIAPTAAIASGTGAESDDLVDAFLEYASAGIKLHAVPVDGLAPPGQSYVGKDFWADAASARNASNPYLASAYAPTARQTAYSTGRPQTATRTSPPNLGYVPVAVAVATGVVLGAQMQRNGSWNRTTYTGGTGS